MILIFFYNSVDTHILKQVLNSQTFIRKILILITQKPQKKNYTYMLKPIYPLLPSESNIQFLYWFTLMNNNNIYVMCPYI